MPSRLAARAPALIPKKESIFLPECLREVLSLSLEELSYYSLFTSDAKGT